MLIEPPLAPTVSLGVDADEGVPDGGDDASRFVLTARPGFVDGRDVELVFASGSPPVFVVLIPCWGRCCVRYLRR